MDLAKKVIKFTVAKGNRPYAVPMSDILAALFKKYQQSGRSTVRMGLPITSNRRRTPDRR